MKSAQAYAARQLYYTHEEAPCVHNNTDLWLAQSYSLYCMSNEGIVGSKMNAHFESFDFANLCTIQLVFGQILIV